MDRPISEDIKKSRRKKAVMKWGGVAAVVVMLAILLPMFMRKSVNRSSIVITDVDRGTIATSLSASGRVEPAFEQVRTAYEEIQNAFSGSAYRGDYYDGEAVTDDITRQLFIKSALLRILAVLSANNLFEVTEKNHDRWIETLKTTLTYIQENYKEKIYIRDLAGLIGMNEQYFCRFFKKVIGRSPMEYVNEYRIKKAIHYLKESDLTVTEICLECGYNNLGNFLREFRKYTSTTPLQYRRHSLKETQ